jgi:predicted ribosomally synthesized peptide with SipW-like signal peptide
LTLTSTDDGFGLLVLGEPLLNSPDSMHRSSTPSLASSTSGVNVVASTEASPESGQRPGKAPKVRAILAGGLVLGVGAAITLAAWNSSEFAQGTFTAGSFNLQGSTNGTSFAENPVGSPATLGFTTNPTNLSPGDVVSAPFAVRLDAASSYDATVTISTEGSTGSLAGLTYELTQSDAFGCAEAVTETLVAAGQTLGTTPASVTFPLTQGADTDPGAPVNLCFRVTAGAVVQAQTGSTTWEFAAQSQ